MARVEKRVVMVRAHIEMAPNLNESETLASCLEQFASKLREKPKKVLGKTEPVNMNGGHNVRIQAAEENNDQAIAAEKDKSNLHNRIKAQIRTEIRAEMKDEVREEVKAELKAEAEQAANPGTNG